MVKWNRAKLSPRIKIQQAEESFTIDSARVELLQVSINLIIRVDCNIDALQEFHSILDVLVRDEIVLIASDGDFWLPCRRRIEIRCCWLGTSVNLLTTRSIINHNECVDWRQSNRFLFRARDRCDDINVASTNRRITLLVDVLNLLHKLFNVRLVGALDGYLIHLTIHLNLLIELQELIVGREQTLGTSDATLDVIFAQHSVHAQLHR